jgi:hypothetical protein
MRFLPSGQPFDRRGECEAAPLGDNYPHCPPGSSSFGRKIQRQWNPGGLGIAPVLRSLSRFILQWLPTIGAVTIGGFLLVAYNFNAASHLARKPLLTDVPSEPRIEIVSQPVAEPTARVVPEPTPSAAEPAAKASPAETKPNRPVQTPRRIASLSDKPRTTRHEPAPAPAPLAIVPQANQVEPTAAAVAPADRAVPDAPPQPKPQEPLKLLGVPVPPVIVAVGEKLDPAPLLRTGGKMIDTVVATAKSAMPDFSR